MDFARFDTRFAAAGKPRRADLRAPDFLVFFERLRAGAALRAADLFLEPVDFRETAALRADVRLRADPRLRAAGFLALLFRPSAFLAEVFLPPLELPRDDFLAAAMIRAPR